MTPILAAAAYLAYLAFWLRGLWHAMLWLRSAHPADPSGPGLSAAALASGVLDLLFFRRLFIADKAAWFCSWAFHASFLLVLACHLRYFMHPVPGLIGFLQPAGRTAGFVLPCAAFLLIVVRAAGGRDAYVSKANYTVLGLAVLIAATGVLMRLSGSADAVSAKAFAHGLFSFRPGPPPASWLFSVHFLAALALVPALPTHIVAAPLVTIAARAREFELPMILHGK
ncbi:MAG: hypothetical protein OHK006_18080 [Thermodesulfovibrionales bacterium]